MSNPNTIKNSNTFLRYRPQKETNDDTVKGTELLFQAAPNNCDFSDPEVNTWLDTNFPTFTSGIDTQPAVNRIFSLTDKYNEIFEGSCTFHGTSNADVDNQVKKLQAGFRFNFDERSTTTSTTSTTTKLPELPTTTSPSGGILNNQKVTDGFSIAGVTFVAVLVLVPTVVMCWKGISWCKVKCCKTNTDEPLLSPEV
jgi:hypothetical protein